MDLSQELTNINCPYCTGLLMFDKRYGIPKPNDKIHQYICCKCGQEAWMKGGVDKLQWIRDGEAHVTTPKRLSYDAFTEKAKKAFEILDKQRKEKEYQQWKENSKEYLKRYIKENNLKR